MKGRFVASFLLLSILSVAAGAQNLSYTKKQAQFSPGLLSAPVTNRQVQQQRTNFPKYAKTTILRYEPDQTELTPIQKELLLRIADRIAEKPGSTIQAIVADKNNGMASERAVVIERFLRSYVHQFVYIVRYIEPENIVPQVDRTVKIIEK